MQCNIDSKGKAVRLIWGMLMLAAAAALAVLILLEVVGGPWWLWAVVGGLGLMGLLGIYESRKGWCAVRAMGFKTPY